ncbi:MAG: GNAT family N-acetyltransferase [Planctomycetaceae bacterium]
MTEVNRVPIDGQSWPTWQFVSAGKDMRAVSQLISSVMGQGYSHDGFTALASLPDLVRIELRGPGTELLGVLLAVASAQGVLHVLFIAVDSAFQRRGLGREVWQKLLAWSRLRRFEKITVHVKTSNSSAISFYNALGLIVERRIPQYYELEDALELSVPLD